MAAAHGGLVLLAAALLVITVVRAEAPSVVVGAAKCADCSRKNMNAAQAFKGLHVAIKCKNSNGEYESTAVGELDAGTGAFSVSVAAGDAAGCFAQLHTAANTPCPGQEPSRIVPLSKGTFCVVAGKITHHSDASPECASATLCGPIKKRLIDHFHKKPVPPKPEPKPQPHPDYHPLPPTPTYEHPSKPTPDYHPVPPTPTYGHPASPSATILGPIKKHLLDHFHKKPVPPKLEPKPQPHPDYHPVPPTPTYGHPSKPTPDYHPIPPTPTYGHPASPSATLCGPIKKIKKHLLDHFHKKPVPPKPQPKPQPQPDYHPVPPTPTYGHPSTPTPIYHPPAQH